MFRLSPENLSKSYGMCSKINLFFPFAYTHLLCVHKRLCVNIIMLSTLTESVHVDSVFTLAIAEQAVGLQLLFSNYLKRKILTLCHNECSLKIKVFVSFQVILSNNSITGFILLTLLNRRTLNFQFVLQMMCRLRSGVGGSRRGSWKGKLKTNCGGP